MISVWTMRQADYPDVTIMNDAEPFVAELKTKPGVDPVHEPGAEKAVEQLAAAPQPSDRPTKNWLAVPTKMKALSLNLPVT